MNLATQSPAELCPLTDSLSSSIRWRMRDYGAILRAELEILAAADPSTENRRPRFTSTPRES
jgi:hypothetical protein